MLKKSLNTNRKAIKRSLISFSQILRYLLVFLGIVAVFFFLLQYCLGYNFTANSATYLLLLSFCFVSFYYLKSKTGYLETVFKSGLIFVAILVVVQRVIVLIPFAEMFSLAGAGRAFTVEEINRGVLTYFASMLVFVFTLKLIVGKKIRSNKAVAIEDEAKQSIYLYSRKIIYLIAFISVVLYFIFTVMFDWRAATVWRYGFLRYLFPLSLYRFIFLIMLIHYKDFLFGRDKIIILLFFALDIFLSVLLGSRGGIINFLFVLIYTFLVSRGDILFKKKYLFLLLPLLFMFIPFLWQMGNFFRSNTSFSLFSSLNVFLGILRRIGIFDNFIMVFNNWHVGSSLLPFVNIVNILRFAAYQAFRYPLPDFPFHYTGLGGMWVRIIWGEARAATFGIQGDNWFALAQLYVMFGLFSLVFVSLFSMLVVTTFYMFRSRNTFLSLLISLQIFITIFVAFFSGGNLDQIISNFLVAMVYTLVFHFLINVLAGPLLNKFRSKTP